MCTQLRDRLCLSGPEKRRWLQKRHGKLETHVPCPLLSPSPHRSPPRLTFFHSTVPSPVVHKMFQEIKTPNTQTLVADIFACGINCYILGINGYKTSNTSLTLQIFVITDAAHPCFGTSSNSAGSRSDNPTEPTATKSGKSPPRGTFADQRRTCGKTSGLKSRLTQCHMTK